MNPAVSPLDSPSNRRPSTASSGVAPALAASTASGLACDRCERTPPNSNTTAAMLAPSAKTASLLLPITERSRSAAKRFVEPNGSRPRIRCASAKGRVNNGREEVMRATTMVSRRVLSIAALAIAAGALALTAFLVQNAGPPGAGAADHLDAPGLTPPGGSVQSDITDLYAFQSPSNPANSVLVLNVNTGAAGSNFTFGRGIPSVGNTKGVLYNYNIDNNGDAVTDVNLRVRFGQPAADGSQQFEVRRNGKLLISMDQGLSTAFGAAPNIVTVGDVKAFAGRRDDPFFFDLAAFLGLNGRSFCDGQQTDFFAG